MDKASKEEINIMASDNDALKKKVGRFITSQEVTARFDGFSIDVAKKLGDRPTIGYVQKLLTENETKLDQCKIILDNGL